MTRLAFPRITTVLLVLGTALVIAGWWSPAAASWAQIVLALTIAFILIARQWERDREAERRDEMAGKVKDERDSSRIVTSLYREGSKMMDERHTKQLANVAQEADARLCERDTSAAHIAHAWASTLRPTTAANKARDWMDDRSCYSTTVVAAMLARAEEGKKS